MNLDDRRPWLVLCGDAPPPAIRALEVPATTSLNRVFAEGDQVAGVVIAVEGEAGPIAARLVRRGFPDLPLVVVGPAQAVGGPTAWAEPTPEGIGAEIAGFDAAALVAGRGPAEVVQALRASVAADRCVYATADGPRWSVVASDAEPSPTGPLGSLPPAYAPPDEVFVCEDAAALPAALGVAHRLGRVRAAVCAPVPPGGCLAVQQAAPRRWRPCEVALVVAVARRLTPPRS